MNLRISFHLKKERDSDPCCNTDEAWGLRAEWNKPVTRENKLYRSTYMRYLDSLHNGCRLVVLQDENISGNGCWWWLNIHPKQTWCHGTVPLKMIKMSHYRLCLFCPNKMQVPPLPDSHMWLAAMVLGVAKIDHFHHPGKFCWISPSKAASGCRLEKGFPVLWDKVVTAECCVLCPGVHRNVAEGTMDHIHSMETWLIKLSFTGFDFNCLCIFCDAFFIFRTINHQPAGDCCGQSPCYPHFPKLMHLKDGRVCLEYRCTRKPEGPMSLQ